MGSINYDPVQKLSTIIEESDIVVSGQSGFGSGPSSPETTPHSTSRQKRQTTSSQHAWEKNGDLQSIPLPALPANDSGHSSSTSSASSAAGAIATLSSSSVSPASNTTSSSSESAISYHPPPSWPIHPPRIEESLKVERLLDEGAAKRRFAKMVQGTHRFRQKHQHPVDIDLVFDQQDNVHQVLLWSHGNLQCHAFEGNAQYIPPELAFRRSSYGDVADVWVLGISLYRMLVGKYPFDASNDRRLFKKMHHGDFTLPGFLSDDAKDLLRRMLAPDRTRASIDLVAFHPWLKTEPPACSSTLVTDDDTPLPCPPTSPHPSSTKQQRRWSSLSSLMHWTSSSSLKIDHGQVSVGALHNNRKRPSASTPLSASPLPKKILVLIVRGPYPPPCKPYRDLYHHPTTSFFK
ncbi:kinase-like protein [Hesseltinella vesiculosa]|uniref:Kinase-like protein n=1 Tax=Hesseltinella vesiculosa TaxID=101127 RepID=A0A1X2GDN7_9FUNG|nr:kinase-like protein [Hesseltinella vesiculosa]